MLLVGVVDVCECGWWRLRWERSRIFPARLHRVADGRGRDLLCRQAARVELCPGRAESQVRVAAVVSLVCACECASVWRLSQARRDEAGRWSSCRPMKGVWPGARTGGSRAVAGVRASAGCAGVVATQCGCSW